MRNTVYKRTVDNITSLAGGVRRRGNVMLFVIFILGTLFAASMAFLALMRTEAGVMTSRRNQAKLDVIFGGLSDDLLLGVADSLMGRGVILTNGDPCDGIGETLAGRIPYVEDARDCEGDQITGGFDQLADNPDMLAHYAMIPGVHPLLSSIEPYSSGLTGTPSLDLEYFAATDLFRAWDGHADVHTGTGGPGDIQPTVPAGHPLRIRKLDEGAPGNAGPFNYPYDRTDDSRATFHGSLADADGDGVVDSHRYRIALVGEGEADWFEANPPGGDAGPDGYKPLLTDDDGSNGGQLCNGDIDSNFGVFKGAPSYTGGLPTPLPCDDSDRNG
ncbi:MAG: hypothetical protein IIA66_11270, partial [Planctomycetes bacterium]|nr:hypothetical protein [Planctomycetota bacterium]